MAMKLIRDDDDEVWVSHYSSNQQILLVGEGDFSFSCSLATSFGSASNIFASSLDSYDDVVRKYKKARSNIETLKRLGASVSYGVDATELHYDPYLRFRRFDRVVFNFPHAGFHGKEGDPSLIRKHRELVFGFFRGAGHLLRAEGQIHVSHKNKAPFCNWNLEELASKCSLVLMQCVAFEKSKYPGYENKRGDGARCDQPFILGECSTFKFILCRVAKELYAEKLKGREAKERESKCPKALLNKQPVSLALQRQFQRPVSFGLGFPLHTEFQGVSTQRPDSFDLSYLRDHNLRQVQEALVQSRERKSPLDLCYYQEHRGPQFVDASMRATERPDLFSLERNHVQFHDNSIHLDKLIYTERSSLQFQDFPLKASHHRQEELFECSSRVNGISHDIYNKERYWTSFPHPYAGESHERRHLLCQDVLVQARQEPFFEYLNRFHRVSHENCNGEVGRQLTMTGFPHSYE